MRRWNGWGDEAISHPLPEAALALLQARLGPGRPPRDASLDAVLSTVPASRLRPHPLITFDALTRLRHARGQSFPDWIALRSGRIPGFPDGVACPDNAADIRTLLAYARETGSRVIPW